MSTLANLIAEDVGSLNRIASRTKTVIKTRENGELVVCTYDEEGRTLVGYSISTFEDRAQWKAAVRRRVIR